LDVLPGDIILNRPDVSIGIQALISSTARCLSRLLSSLTLSKRSIGYKVAKSKHSASFTRVLN
jgi:hypothetical protein